MTNFLQLLRKLKELFKKLKTIFIVGLVLKIYILNLLIVVKIDVLYFAIGACLV